MLRIHKLPISLLILVLFIALTQPLTAGSKKVNINTASKNELTVLKYVGDKLADRIITYRKNQPFQKTEDLMNVKGVGKKVYEANKGNIVVGDKQKP